MPFKINGNYNFDYEKSNNKFKAKKKQKKIKWSAEEQRLFLEGLEKYGIKSNK